MRLAFAVLLLAAAVLAGCANQGTAPGNSASSSSVASGPSGPPPTSPMPPADTASATGDGLRMVATANVTHMGRSGSAAFAWNVTNLGADATYEPAAHCRPAGEWDPRIAVADASGAPLALQPADSPACMIATQQVDLPPGASATSSWTWDGSYYAGQEHRHAGPGTYTVTATFWARRGDQSAQVTASLPLTIDG